MLQSPTIKSHVRNIMEAPPLFASQPIAAHTHRLRLTH